MPVKFVGPNGEKTLTPAPLVTISKSYIRDGKNAILHPQYNISLNGTIVNVGNSLDSPGTEDNTSFGDMDDILAEQARIREIFTVDGGKLTIDSPDGGSNTIEAHCTVESVEFQRSTWTTRCEYTISLATPKIIGDTESITELQSNSENWSIAENPDGTFAITHNLEAVGLPIYVSGSLSNDPQELAKDWCKDRSVVLNDDGFLSYSNAPSGIDFSNVISNINSVSGNYWNYAISENPGISNGSWQISETFIHDPSGSAREQFSVSRNFDGDNPKRTSISINGTITGNAARARNWELRSARASGYFSNSVQPNLYSRATSYKPDGFSVSPIPNTKQITFNRNGTLNYTYTFTATSGTLFEDAREESINVSDTAQTDVFAEIQVPGRIDGPVVQDMRTKTLPQRTVNISVTYDPITTAITVNTLRSQYLSKPDTSGIVDALKPQAGYYYLTQNSEEWNPINRQYSRVVTWTLQPEGSGISGIPEAIHNTAGSGSN